MVNRSDSVVKSCELTNEVCLNTDVKGDYSHREIIDFADDMLNWVYTNYNPIPYRDVGEFEVWFNQLENKYWSPFGAFVIFQNAISNGRVVFQATSKAMSEAITEKEAKGYVKLSNPVTLDLAAKRIIFN